MGHELRIRIKTLVMVLAMVVCANVGDLMLKRGMTQIGAVEISPVGLQHALLSTITNGTIWIGIFFLTGFMFSYMTVLRMKPVRKKIPNQIVPFVILEKRAT